MNDATSPAAHTPLPSAEPAASVAAAASTPADPLATAEPLAALRRRAGRRLAVLSLLGAVMVVLPLVQVLRYQNAEEAALIAERAGLDPVTRAVDVQRGLLVHRDISTLVLHGRSEQEPERKVRQGEVDDRVGALALTLASGQWQRAVQESDALRDDWGLLARQVGSRSISADESEQAHRLLVEQTLQVMDIVADVMAPRSGASSGTPSAATAGILVPSWDHLFSDKPQPADQDAGRVQAALATAHALPRLAWQMALLLPRADARTGSAVLPRNELAAVEAGLARTLGALNAALAKNPRPTLAAAGAAAGVAADGYFQALRSQALRSRGVPAGHGGNNADLQRSAAQALQAQFDLFQYAHDEAANGLGMQIEAAQAQRSHWLTGMAALAVVWLAVLLGAVRTLRAPAAPPPQDQAALPATNLPPAEHDRGEAGRLLQRLRQGDDRHAWAGTRPGVANNGGQRDASQPTLPGGL